MRVWIKAAHQGLAQASTPGAFAMKPGTLIPWLRHDIGCPAGEKCICGLTAAVERESDAWLEVAAALRVAAERLGQP